MLKALTGNDLLNGHVVFLTEDGGWSTDPADARLASDDAALAALEQAAKDAESRCEAISLDIIDMTTDGGKPWPARYREQIRALGPSVRRDLGYQAGQEA
ncbi:MAG: hypothetical protein Tsb0016_18420 [Sphingomonadales bacterium]